MGRDPTLGGSPQERDQLELADPEELVSVRESAMASLASGSPFARRVRARRADGRLRLLEARADVVHDETGRAVGLQGFVQDITELARAEQRQRAVAELGQLALEDLDVDVLLQHAVDAVGREFGIDGVGVLEVLPGGEHALVRARSGPRPRGPAGHRDRRRRHRGPRAGPPRAGRLARPARGPARSGSPRSSAQAGRARRGRGRDRRPHAPVRRARRVLGAPGPLRRGRHRVPHGGRQRAGGRASSAARRTRRSPRSRPPAAGSSRRRSTARTAPGARSPRPSTTAPSRSCSRSASRCSRWPAAAATRPRWRPRRSA